jgi:hypothetical protein
MEPGAGSGSQFQVGPGPASVQSPTSGRFGHTTSIIVPTRAPVIFKARNPASPYFLQPPKLNRLQPGTLAPAAGLSLSATPSPPSPTTTIHNVPTFVFEDPSSLHKPCDIAYLGTERASLLPGLGSKSFSLFFRLPF